MTILRRREFLRAAAAVAASQIVAAPGLALAPASGDKRFVVVLLRGGMDGLAAIAPYGDLTYNRMRGSLALDPPGRNGGLLRLDDQFGLHPGLSSLWKPFKSGDLLPIHAVGVARSRSHFRSQDILELGTANSKNTLDGWLNRLLQYQDHYDAGSAVAISRTVPKILRGSAAVGTLSSQILPAAETHFVQAVQAIYREDTLFGPALLQGVRLRAEMDRLQMVNPLVPGRRWNFAQSAAVAGALLSSPIGPRIAVLQSGGWDTHGGQGTVGGRIGNLFAGLNGAMINLRTALAGAWDQSVVLIVSEFGRTISPNGSAGTDHGSGGLFLAYGGAVNGGNVLTDWPGLTGRASRNGADLRPTIEARAIFKGVLQSHLKVDGNALDEFIFPNSRTIRPLTNLIRS